MIEINSFYNEDCFVTMEHMIEEGFKVDNIITSPPYNNCNRGNSESERKHNRGRYDTYQDKMPNDEYIQWTIRLFKKFDKILGEDGCILYNLSYGNENNEVMWLTISHIIQETSFTIADDIIWKKSNALPQNRSKNKLTRIVEHILVFCRKGEYNSFNTNKEISKIGINGCTYYKNINNFIEAPNNDGSCDLNKATFSTELINKLIRIYVPKESIVYDHFMGTGTTANACLMNNIDFIGSEISSAQVDYSRDRISNFKSKSNVSLENYF